MEATIQKWGNSLAIRIPKSFAEEAHVHNGTTVDLSIKKGDLIIHPISEKPSLKDMLKGINKSNIHNDIDFGGPLGKEAL